jgi:hypothetical protein
MTSSAEQDPERPSGDSPGAGRRDARPRGKWNRFLLTFLGPPTLGDPSEPPPAPAPEPAPCPLCGRPLKEHSYVQTNGVRGLRCAAPEA